MAFDENVSERSHCRSLVYLILLNAFIIAFFSCANGSVPLTDHHQSVAEHEGCLSNPCFNGAQCLHDIDGYRCQCNDGFTGLRCETDIDDCASKPCLNGGKCVDETNTYRCICGNGYKGVRCQDEIDECISDPCLNGATCVDSINRFSCRCRKGFKGTFCEDIDICASNPCRHGSKCIPAGIGKYTCKCKAGYSGNRCENNIDECISEPCQNRGTCIDGVNRFTCSCRDGFTGIYCQTDIDECASNPCSKNAVCVQGRNKYTCRCKRGYSGENCQTDECASHPCKNGATCKQGINTYKCYCKKGFTGTNCQISPKAQEQNSTEQNTQSSQWLIYPGFILVITVLLMKGGDVSHWITNLKIVQDIFRFFGISAKKPKSNTSGNSAKRTRSQPYENLRGKMLNTCIINRKEYDKNFDLAKQLANEGAILTYDDIPWPNKNGRDGDCDILFEGMDITSTEYKERVRKERFRWHPDKFAHKFGNSLKPEDEYAIMTRVNDISQNINELIEMDKDMSYD